MKIHLFDNRTLVKIFENVIDLKVCGDEWFIKSKDGFIEFNVKFTAKDKNSIHVIYE